MLKRIIAEDLLFTNEIEDDRTNTFLTLNDYDWMSYVLKTAFRTIEQGILKITFSYNGFNLSTMDVEQFTPTLEMFETNKFDEKEMEKKEYHYSYDTSIFQKYIIEFLKKHISMWDDSYAFNGEEFVIDFYNEVLENGFLTDGKHLDVPLEKNS